jgi:hypothetical protein
MLLRQKPEVQQGTLILNFIVQASYYIHIYFTEKIYILMKKIENGIIPNKSQVITSTEITFFTDYILQLIFTKILSYTDYINSKEK